MTRTFWEQGVSLWERELHRWSTIQNRNGQIGDLARMAKAAERLEANRLQLAGVK